MRVVHRMSRTWKRANLIYILVAVLGVSFIIGSYRAALFDHEGSIGYFMLYLSFTLPEVLIWLLAAIGAVQLKNYALSIRGSRDGAGINYIANSLLLLVLYVILISLTGTSGRLVADTEWEDLVIIINNHLPLLAIFISAVYLWVGSKLLLQLVDRPRRTPWVPSFWFCLRAVLFTSFAIIFTLNFYHFVTEVQDNQDVVRFSAPPVVLLFSYVLPHLITWLFGALACMNLAVYAHKVPGVIYKDLFRDLQRGVVLVFVCTFFAQILRSSILTDESFSPLLLLVYAVLLLGILGFYLIYHGTRRLEQLEQ